MSTEPCQFLQWDTDFFGKRIARANEHRLSPSYINEVMDWCATNDIACLYFLADIDHAETVRLAEANSFRFVDVRMTLQHKLGKIAQYKIHQPDDISVRLAKESDIPQLQAIARVSYDLTRYYYDPCFSEKQRADLYSIWIKRSYEGYAEAVLVATINEEPFGYIACHLSQDKMRGQIGIVGVASQVQGRGIGWILVNNALRWFTEQGAEIVDVVTQARNIQAQRLYQRSGFLTHAVQLWYHRWFIDCE